MNQNTSNEIKSDWVMANLAGKAARTALDHADVGIGYFVLERPENGSGYVTVAFRRPQDSPMPEGVSVVMNPQLIAKLDKMYNYRHGIREDKAIQQVTRQLDDLRQTLFTSKQETTGVHRKSMSDAERVQPDTVR